LHLVDKEPILQMPCFLVAPIAFFMAPNCVFSRFL
jgi:hypothetical protein